MEAEDVAEWRLLRGEDWDTVTQPIQVIIAIDWRY